jgi:diketogulonate reductase-like aldo/keto reductase
MERRDVIRKITGLGLAMLAPSLSFGMQHVIKRKIPSTGEMIPSVGVGTWQTFDVSDDDSETMPLREVLRTMVAQGLTVVDSSPMYGRSEERVGTLSQAENINDKLFIATKVWTSGKQQGIDQMNTSLALLQRKQIDLMQVHNLLDWQTHLQTLNEWKEKGRIRYVGLTHYLDSTHETVEKIIRQHKVDFIQMNYSLVSRHAEKRLFPAAKDLGVAVIVNRPFEEGALFSLVKNKSLPEWAAEFDCRSWGQFFLKFIVSHPSVTCAIPGTSKVRHLLDNAGAATGKLPNEKQRAKMIALLS